jgi:cell division protein FtsA
LSRNDLIAGLDIGTTKICCVVAESGADDTLMVTGVGIAPSRGMQRGVVVDIEETVRAVEEAVSRAARQSGREIHSVTVGVTGQHIASLNSHGVTAITHPHREIDDEAVRRVNEQSQVIVIPPDRTILHAIPRSYSIDGQNGIRHPQGMSGTRLEVETHIVTGARTFIENVEKCVTRAGITVDEMVLEPLATAEAVLMPAERSLGVCLIDIGGGTTDLAVFQNGSIFYSAVIPVGGNHVTNDLAQLLRVTTEEAERLKIDHGASILATIPEEETVPVVQIGRAEPRQLRRRALVEIIEARMQELFQLVEKEIEKSGCKGQLSAGLVVTGGGSQLRGAVECAGQSLQCPVRAGKPPGGPGLGDSVSTPVHATAVGLVRYAARVQDEGHAHHHGGEGSPLGGAVRFFKGLWTRLGAH